MRSPFAEAVAEEEEVAEGPAEVEGEAASIEGRAII